MLTWTAGSHLLSWGFPGISFFLWSSTTGCILAMAVLYSTWCDLEREESRASAMSACVRMLATAEPVWMSLIFLAQRKAEFVNIFHRLSGPAEMLILLIGDSDYFSTCNWNSAEAEEPESLQAQLQHHQSLPRSSKTQWQQPQSQSDYHAQQQLRLDTLNVVSDFRNINFFSANEQIFFMVPNSSFQKCPNFMTQK